MIFVALAVCCWALAGCGSEPDVAGNELSAQPEPDDGQTTIKVGKAEASSPGAWRLWSEQSSVTIGDDDESRIDVSGVTGELLEDGEVASRFASDKGQADTKTGRLVLDGRVKITSETDDIYLTASKVTYIEQRELIVAEGEVWIRSSGWTAGPFAKLVCNPGLQEFGTPDRFEL